jgi:hypothetical protein
MFQLNINNMVPFEILCIFDFDKAVLGIRIRIFLGPLGSRSISQMYGSGSGTGSFPFLKKGLERTKIMLAK